MIVRADHSGDYLQISNATLMDQRLSCEAVGLLARMLSLPDSWSFSVAGLVSYMGISEKTLRRLIRELRRAGYIEFKQKRTAQGFFETVDWIVYEEPIRMSVIGVADTGVADNRMSVCGVAVSGIAVSGIAANGRLQIPNIQKPNIKKTKGIKSYMPACGEFSNVLITDAEFQKLTDRFGEAGRDSRIENLSRYLAQHPRKKHASHYATILAWDSRDKKAAKVDRSQPQQQKPAGGVDWDNVAKLAAEMAAGEVPYYDFD